jgi:hypothetical protein
MISVIVPVRAFSKLVAAEHIPIYSGTRIGPEAPDRLDGINDP